MPSQHAVILRFLGPLEVVVDGQAVHPGGPNEHCSVIWCSTPVSIAALVEAVRGDDAPDGAIRSLRTYASNLRRLLGPASDLEGEQGTYRLDLLSVETEIHRFRAVAKEASSLKDPHERSKMFGAALDLWRGPLLAELDHPWLQEESANLEWER